MGVPSKQTVSGWAGLTVVDPAGETVGTVTALYVDATTDQPEWLCVERPDGHALFVPVIDAEEVPQGVQVQFSAQQMTSAPTFGEPRELTKEEEAELYRHYGVPFTEAGSVLPTGGVSTGPAGGGAPSTTATSKDPAAAARTAAQPPATAPDQPRPATAPQPYPPLAAATPAASKPSAQPSAPRSAPARPAVQPVRPVTAPAAAPASAGRGLPASVFVAGGLATGIVALVLRRRRRRNAADRVVDVLRRHV